MVVIGGRAPQLRWGQGSLQEIDHIPFVTPLTRSARTAEGPHDIQPSLDAAFVAAQGPPGGPAFVDISLDHVFMEAEPSTTVPAPPPDGTTGRVDERTNGSCTRPA
jgi:acetolactate synthase-1/2/3 large subunit